MKLNLTTELRESLKAMPKNQAAKIIRGFLPQKVLSVENELLNKNGEFVRIVLERPAKVYQKSVLLGRIRKHSETTVQADVSYLNKAAVIAAHASGEVERKPNPNDIYLSKVLVYNSNTDKIRFGFGTVKNPLLKRKSSWLLDGKPVAKETVASELQADELKKKPESNWINLLPDNIITINRFENPAFEG